MSVARAVVLLSCGLDSIACLATVRDEGLRDLRLVGAYGQRHAAELAAARRVAAALGTREHREARVNFGQFGGSALTDANIAVPTGWLAGHPGDVRASAQHADAVAGAGRRDSRSSSTTARACSSCTCRRLHIRRRYAGSFLPIRCDRDRRPVLDGQLSADRCSARRQRHRCARRSPSAARACHAGEKTEGGTILVPGHGRISDEADGRIIGPP